MLKKLATTFLLLTVLAVPAAALAQSQLFSEFNKSGTELYGSEDSPPNLFELAGTIVTAVLSVLGLVLLILIVYAGALWMTAGGNPEQVAKAKSMLVNAVIGLIIIITSFAVTSFLVTQLERTSEPIEERPGPRGGSF